MSGKPVPFWRRLEAGALLPLAAGLRRLPPPARVAVGERLGLLGHAIDRRHRELARENVRRGLGVDEARAAEIVRGVFRHFGRVAAEVLSLPAYARPGAERLFEIEGFEHLETAWARGRGVLVFSAHYGNWELVAFRQGLAGFPMDFIARPLDNPWLERAFARWREVSGNRVLGKHGALRKALRTLRSGRGLAILVDQNQRVEPRVFVEFLGRPAATSPVLGELAVRLDVPVVPVTGRPLPGGRYRVVYEPPLVPPPGDPREASRALTVMATRRIEAWIREAPELWLWLHDRWKTGPREGEEVLR